MTVSTLARRPVSRFRLSLLVVLVTVLTGAGCASSWGSNRAATVRAEVGAVLTKPQAAINAYLPGDVVAHPGDTVVFTNATDGEPHTVTLGTRVDQALAALAEGGRRGATSEPPALEKLTRLLPNSPGDENQAALSPCYLERGDPPSPGPRACVRRPQPAFDGRQAFFNSGYLPAKSRFSLKLDDDITPGGYGFMCLLQREMVGQLTVLDPSEELPSPAAVRRTVDRGRAPAVRALSRAVDQASKETGVVAAGVAVGTTASAVGQVFAPGDKSVPVGGSVTWDVMGTHAIAFAPPDRSGPLLIKGPGGGWRLNRAVVEPVGGPGAPDVPAAPWLADAQEPEPVEIDGGSWDGNGFRSSGLLRASPRARLKYRLAFSAPGTYSYRCLIHPDMSGVVRVG